MRRDEPEHGERAVEEGERARVHPRAAHAAADVVGLPGDEPQSADDEVHAAMQRR